MFVITLDQIHSQSRPDGVPGMLEQLSTTSTYLGFERTAGDEIQGALSEPDAALSVINVALRQGCWHIGVGAGAITNGATVTSTREATGPAYFAAREAVERSKTLPSTTPLAVVSSQSRIAADLEAALHLSAALITQRTATQWRIIDAMLTEPDATQAEIGKQLGMTHQAVSKALARAWYTPVNAAQPLLLRLLQELDANA